MIFIDILWSNPHSTPGRVSLPSVSVEGIDSGTPAGLPAQGHKLAKGQGKTSNASQSHSIIINTINEDIFKNNLAGS